jgi:Fe-S-cluster containining protein
MELSSDDIRRLEEAGYRRDQFSVLDDRGVRLVNVDGWCFFYSLAERNCRVYKDRPLGCRLYPAVHSADEGVIVDELCPMRHTVSERELKRKGKILVRLLSKIDDERKCE